MMFPFSSTRRRFLAQGTRLAGVALAMPWMARAAPPKARVLERKIISQQPQYYHGWATVARRRNGALWVSWSGGRESHVCPFGQVHAMSSRDEGATWTWPRVLLDGAIDDRDSGVLETARGTLLVTSFSSLAYEAHLEKAIMYAEHGDAGWATRPLSPERLARWKAAHMRLDDAGRKAELGEWALRSTDDGISWSARIATIVNSPHGPIQLRDGRLLYAGKQLWTADRKVGVCESLDDGLTWRWLAAIPARGGDSVRDYHELHVVEAANGTLVAQIRNHNKTSRHWTLQTESVDGGRTWTEPHPICYGLPAHLLRLRDERLVMSYGYRRRPFGNRARISDDHGRSWSDEIVISADGANGDLGYPSTVELGDGTLLTVWYEAMAEHPLAVLRQATWRLE